MKHRLIELMKPVLLIVIILFAYMILMYMVNYRSLKYASTADQLILLKYVGSYLSAVLITRLFSFYIGGKEGNYISLPDVLLLMVIFLIISSLLVDPLSFVRILSPFRSNIIVHFFIISLIPLCRHWLYSVKASK